MGEKDGEKEEGRVRGKTREEVTTKLTPGDEVVTERLADREEMQRR